MKNIKSIEIKTSPFFEDFKIHFSEKMNCIMGGRGTGKSSILYFLKSSLSLDSQKGKINDILKSNLGIGEIIIEIESEDGSLFRIVKTFNEDPQPYKLPNQDYISLVRIFDEIECDFYETNQIEEIGRSAKDRLALIDKKIKIDLYDLVNLIKKAQIDLDANAQDIKTSNFRINQIKDSLLQYENVVEEIKEFKKNEPIDIKPDEKLEFENADVNEKKRTDEKRFFVRATSLYNDLQNQIVLFKNDLEENFESTILNSDNFFNKNLIFKHIVAIQANNKSVFDKLSEIDHLLKSNSQLLNANYLEIVSTHEIQQAEFVTLKQKFDKNRDYFNKYNLLTNRLKEKETLELEVVERELKRKRFVDERKFMVLKFNEIKNNILRVIYLVSVLFDYG